MIDLITKPEEVEPPNMDSEKNWTGFEIPSSSPSSPKELTDSHDLPACAHFIPGCRGQDKKKKEAEGMWNPSHLDSVALTTRLSLNKTEGYCYRTKSSKAN
jgi:hypothetical protein